jgi:hydrogenase expression/formation protein HypC
VCLAIPAQLKEIVPDEGLLGIVEVTGVRRKVDLSLIEDEHPAPGDWVLVHVGFAMSKISEADAAEQMRVLRVLGEDAAAMEELSGYGADEPERPPGGPP